MAYVLKVDVSKTEQIEAIPAADRSAGDAEIFGDDFGFYLANTATGDKGALVTRAPIVEATAEATNWTIGDPVYDDNNPSSGVVSSTGTRKIGTVYRSVDLTGLPVAERRLLIKYTGGNG